MLTVTEKARKFLHHALTDKEEDECFRLLRGQRGGLSLVAGRPVGTDVKIEHEQRTVLAVEPELAEDLEGRKVDVEVSAEGKTGLVLA